MKHGLVSLQKTLICRSVGEKDIKLSNLHKGIQIIKSRLFRKKVLLILDNVDKLEQIKALAGGHDWFGLGSRIIITTRKTDLLRRFGVQRTYEVEPLNHEDALELFSWNAFKRKEVIRSYEEISKTVVHYSNYLPLSLEMIGLGFRVGMLSKEKMSSDFDRTVSECNSSLDAYERIRHENIQEIPYVRDSEKDNINCNVDEDNAQNLRVRYLEKEEEKEQIRKEKAEAHLDTIIHDNNNDKINCNVNDEDIAQHHRVRYLAEEQEEKEQIRKEKINCKVDDNNIAQHNRCYSQQPKPQPIKYKRVEHLSHKLDNSKVDLSHLGAELRLLNVFYHKIDKVVIHTISLPKQSSVEDVINYLKSKVELSHLGAELRLLKIFYHKIHKVFSPSEKIENINDHWTLRAEEIPEEEKNVGSHDQLIHVYHFMKVTAQNQEQIQNFGDPFFLAIHNRERLANIKLRIQKKLQVPNEEFSKWMFAFVLFGRPEYLKDSDIVSTPFKGRDIYGAWKYCYLGLEHADNAPKSSYAANQVEMLQFYLWKH